MKNITILLLTLCPLFGTTGMAQENTKLTVVGDEYSTGRMINFEVTTTLGESSDMLQMVAPSGSVGQFIEFENGNSILGRINANGNIEFKNARFDGAENTGLTAALDIRSGFQRMLLDGNEIDGVNSGLYLNHNSQENIYLRTAATKSEINLKHENGSGASGNGVTIIHPGNNNEYWTFYVTNGDGNLELYNRGALRGEFSSTSGTYSAPSDRRLKENIRDFEDVLPKLALLKPKTYHFKKDKTGKEHIGFIAQDVAQVFPHLVNKGEGDSGKDTYTMDYSGFGVIAIAAIQELQVQLEEKEEDVTELEEKVTALEAQLAQYTTLEERLSALETNLQSCCMQQQLNTTGNAEPTSQTNDKATLEQNAPNPFSRQTRIPFYLPADVQNASLQITDPTGKVVKKYRIDHTGFGQVQLQAGELPAGVYTYTLLVNNQLIAAKQMILTP